MFNQLVGNQWLGFFGWVELPLTPALRSKCVCLLKRPCIFFIIGLRGLECRNKKPIGSHGPQIFITTGLDL